MAESESHKTSDQTYLCRRCGRKLKSIESQERGMGITCYNKWYNKQEHKILFTVNTLQSVQSSV
jgi:hypothetical protein